MKIRTPHFLHHLYQLAPTDRTGLSVTHSQPRRHWYVGLVRLNYYIFSRPTTLLLDPSYLFVPIKLILKQYLPGCRITRPENLAYPMALPSPCFAGWIESALLPDKRSSRGGARQTLRSAVIRDTYAHTPFKSLSCTFGADLSVTTMEDCIGLPATRRLGGATVSSMVNHHSPGNTFGWCLVS